MAIKLFIFSCRLEGDSLLDMEQIREFYPLTFYPESLENIIKDLKQKRNKKIRLEPIPIKIKKVHYLNSLIIIRFYIRLILLVTLILFILGYLVDNQALFILIIMLLLCLFYYLVLSIIIIRITNDIVRFNSKILTREYKILESNLLNDFPSKLLFNSLLQRENIYNFEIDDGAKRGISEADFLAYLTKWFVYPWRILENCKFRGERYTPTADFILINNDYNLGVDIEIDEPYTLKTLEPVHVVEDQKYVVRDKLFLELGYIVIRFAEYQIVKYPDYCCLHIARVLNQFLDSHLKIPIPDSIDITAISPEQWQVKTWTSREAQIMAENRVRDRYLNLNQTE